MDLESAYSLYVQSKSKNVFPSQNVYASLLSLTAGFGEQGSGLGPIREVEPPSDFEAAYNVFCDMREKKINFVESMYTAMIRCFCINDRLNEALCLYEEMLSKNVQPKLRTYNPLLKIGASSQNIDLCFRLYREMTENFRLVPSEKEYNSMLSITTSKRDQRFYEILNTMSQDIYIPSVNTWDIVKVWFSQLSDPYVCTTSTISTSGKVEVNGDILLSLDLDENTRQELLTQIESLATSDSALVSERSLLDISMNDKHDISLYHTEVNPDSLEFNKDPVTCESILKTTLVDTQHDVKDTSHLNQDVSEYTGVIKKGRKYFKTISSIARIRHFSEFKAWTEKAKLENDELIGSTSSHNQWKYNVIVDGANVGYYKQNYISAPGHVDYHQIDWMLRHLKYLGFRPLLILHCRHLNVQSLNLPTSTISMIESWKKSDMLYVTPSGCNDDWYWLYCAVYFRCKSVTNDEMRDHHFQMLSPR
jgi:pentatricopeptide repeat protein